MKIDTDARNLMADAVADEFDSVAGTLKIYESSGTPPASADDAPNGTVLATIDLPTPAFGAAASGTVSKTGTWEDASADATGTADYARLEDSEGKTYQLTVTVTDGGGELELSSVDIQAGGQISITSFDLTMPAGS